MEPRLLEVLGDPPEADILAMVARHLDSEGVVAIPTETVYGFGSALRDRAIREVQRLKGRGMDQPFLILVSGPQAVSDLEWTPLATELSEIFWPGALTLILKDPHRRFPPGVRSLDGKVAIRHSPHPMALGLVEALGEPIISTSVNPPGEVPALTAREAMEISRSLGAGGNLWVLDGGRLPPSHPSTIVDCSRAEPVVVRAGSIPVNRLRCVLPGLEGPD